MSDPLEPDFRAPRIGKSIDFIGVHMTNQKPTDTRIEVLAISEEARIQVIKEYDELEAENERLKTSDPGICQGCYTNEAKIQELQSHLEVAIGALKECAEDLRRRFITPR